MIYYPDDYVIIIERHWETGHDKQTLCAVADSKDVYDDTKDAIIAIRLLDETTGWWESSKNITKVTKETDPEYFL